jgi:hypothetical protein
MSLPEMSLLLSLIALAMSGWTIAVLHSGLAELERIARDAVRRDAVTPRYTDATRRSRN